MIWIVCAVRFGNKWKIVNVARDGTMMLLEGSDGNISQVSAWDSIWRDALNTPFAKHYEVIFDDMRGELVETPRYYRWEKSITILVKTEAEDELRASLQAQEKIKKHGKYILDNLKLARDNEIKEMRLVQDRNNKIYATF